MMCAVPVARRNKSAPIYFNSRLGFSLIAALGIGGLLAGEGRAANIIVQSGAYTSDGVGDFDQGAIAYSTSTGPQAGTYSQGYASATPTFSSSLVAGQTSGFANYSVTDSVSRKAAATASADFATGSMHLFASGNANGTHASAQAQLMDNVTFSVAGAAPGQPTPITVHLRIAGSLSGDSTSIGEINLAGFDFEGLINGNTDGNVVYVGDLSGGLKTISRLSASSAWVSTDFTGTTADNLVFTGVYDLIGPSEKVLLDMNLIASVTSEGSLTTADYSHTGQISFDLPSNVTFTDESGVLLQPPSTSAVPEPGTLTILASAIGLLTTVRRGARRAHPKKAQA
jgi:hypothetical protein